MGPRSLTSAGVPLPILSLQFIYEELLKNIVFVGE